MHLSVTKTSGRKVVCPAAGVGGIQDRLPAEGASHCTCHSPMLHLRPRAGQGGSMCIIHHLASLSPGAPDHHSSTNAIKLLHSDLLNFKRSFGIHQKKTQNKRSFFDSFWKVFSFLLCWSCDCLVYSAILKGLSGSHRGKRFPCDQSCAVQKE